MTAAERTMQEIAELEDMRERVQNMFPDVTFPDPTLEPIFIGRLQKKPVEGRMAIVDSETGQFYNFCTDKYRLTYHEEVVGKAVEALNQLTEFGEAKLKVNFLNKGARLNLEVEFPKCELEVRKGDKVIPRVQMRSSVDLSWELYSAFGARQLVCANGLIAHRIQDSFRRKHRVGLDVGEFVNRIGTGMERFASQVEQWQGWDDKKIRLPEWEMITCELPVSDAEMCKIYELPIKGLMGTPSMKTLLKKDQATLWTVNSAATQYNTHEIKSDNRRIDLEMELAHSMDHISRTLH